MMVLLPHAHLALGMHAVESAPCETSHPHDHDHPAAPNPHGHDSCSLCQLLNLSAQTSDTVVAAQVLFLPTTAFPAAASFTDHFAPTSPRARAPPFATA